MSPLRALLVPVAIALASASLALPRAASAQLLVSLEGAPLEGVLFDEPVRDALRLHTPQEQAVAAQISDVLLVTTLLGAHGLSAVALPALDGNDSLFWSGQFAHLSALAVTLALGEALREVFARPRPYARECAIDPRRERCDADDLRRSFYSLHAAMSFTSAGFVCATHAMHGDGGALDVAACASSLLFAGATALLRVVADRHYLSDTLVGALLGALVGALAPFAITHADVR